MEPTYDQLENFINNKKKSTPKEKPSVKKPPKPVDALFNKQNVERTPEDEDGTPSPDEEPVYDPMNIPKRNGTKKPPVKSTPTPPPVKKKPVVKKPIPPPEPEPEPEFEPDEPEDSENEEEPEDGDEVQEFSDEDDEEPVPVRQQKLRQQIMEQVTTPRQNTQNFKELEMFGRDEDTRVAKLKIENDLLKKELRSTNQKVDKLMDWIQAKTEEEMGAREEQVVVQKPKQKPRGLFTEPQTPVKKQPTPQQKQTPPKPQQEQKAKPYLNKRLKFLLIAGGFMIAGSGFYIAANPLFTEISPYIAPMSTVIISMGVGLMMFGLLS